MSFYFSACRCSGYTQRDIHFLCGVGAAMKGLCYLIFFHVQIVIARAINGGSSVGKSGLMRSAGTESLTISETGSFQESQGERQKHARQNRSAVERVRQTQWTDCSPSCQCSSRRRMVIRYRPRIDTVLGSAVSCTSRTNWWYRQHTDGYTGTPPAEFNKGFDFAGLDNSEVTNLPQCGNNINMPNVGVCPEAVMPSGCQFDQADGGNPYDAKVGQYCCDSDLGYCSYHCADTDEGVDGEVFTCPEFNYVAPPETNSDDMYPGGMDPCEGWPKACYQASYEDGSTPEDGGDTGTDR